MEQIILEQVNKELFNNIVLNFKGNNFFQTSYMGNSLEKRGKKVYYLGLKVGENHVGATLLYESGSFLGKKIFECLKGFLVDYNNFNLLRIFTDKLLDFIKELNGFKLIIDPYVVEIERDIDGNVVVDGIDNRKIINNLRRIGYVKSKYNVQVKTMFCLDVKGKNEGDIFKDFKATTRNLINKAIREGVEVIDLKYEQLSIFKSITDDTCKRRGFFNKSLQYFQSMYNEFGDKVVFKLARLNVKKHMEFLEKAKRDYEQKLGNIKSNQKKLNNYFFEIENINKKIDKINSITDDEYINLSVGMFMLYGDETIYLFSGGNDEYNEYGGQYLIQWDIINYAINNGYRRHNFFGIFGCKEGLTDYGIYLFKRGFNGYVEELLGQYYICTKSLVGKIYNLLEKLK